MPYLNRQLSSSLSALNITAQEALMAFNEVIIT